MAERRRYDKQFKMERDELKKAIIYLKISITTMMLLLLLVSAFNFVYDPGEIYFKKIIKQKYLDRYVTLLMKTKIGLPFFSNERLVKYRLAQISDRNSFIIGSSHAMEFTTTIKPSSIYELVGYITNLGVSGGSFEDLTIFSGLLMERSNVKNIVFCIDPWTLKFNMDSRWGIFQDDYRKYSEIFAFAQDKVEHRESYLLKIIKNIINKEYFIRSLGVAKKEKLSVMPINVFTEFMQPVENINPEVGINTPITMNDGSHINSADYIKKAKEFKPSRNQTGLGSYKIEGNFFDDRVIKLFGNIIDNLKARGINIYIVMTPYHPAVFNKRNENIFQYLRNVELEIRKFAEGKGIKCFGSYDPRILGCQEDEFYDDMHLTRRGLNRIKFH